MSSFSTLIEIFVFCFLSRLFLFCVFFFISRSSSLHWLLFSYSCNFYFLFCPVFIFILFPFCLYSVIIILSFPFLLLPSRSFSYRHSFFLHCSFYPFLFFTHFLATVFLFKLFYTYFSLYNLFLLETLLPSARSVQSLSLHIFSSIYSGVISFLLFFLSHSFPELPDFPLGFVHLNLVCSNKIVPSDHFRL